MRHTRISMAASLHHEAVVNGREVKRAKMSADEKLRFKRDEKIKEEGGKERKGRK